MLLEQRIYIALVLPLFYLSGNEVVHYVATHLPATIERLVIYFFDRLSTFLFK